MKNRFNYFLFFLVAVLVSFSLLFLAALSSLASLQRFGNTNYFLFHQLFYGLLPALVLGFAAYKVSLKFLKKWAPLLVLLNIIALFLVFIPFIGSSAGGATRWINFGKFTVQPAEFLKITAILYLSAWIASKLSDNKESGWKFSIKKGYYNLIYIFVPFAVFLAVIFAALYLQRDASTMGIITLTLLAIYFSAKTPLWHTLLIVMGGASALLFMVKFEPYRLDRWLCVFNPNSDSMGKCFQFTQSLISLGSGGFFGKGLGMSTQKFGFLPQAMTDSIFAIIGEELGIIGGIIIIGLFLSFFWLGLKIAKNSEDKFSRMTATGIVFWITLQAFINISSAAGIFPLAGIPLPFFSYGGSHLAVELIGVGILLNISKNT